jgi:hypothetical protein
LKKLNHQQYQRLSATAVLLRIIAAGAIPAVHVFHGIAVWYLKHSKRGLVSLDIDQLIRGFAVPRVFIDQQQGQL